MPICIVERLSRGSHCVDDEIIDLALDLRLHPLVWIEGTLAAVAARHNAGDLARQIGDVEAVDHASTAPALEDAPPRRFDTAAERRHHAEARDGNPPHV